MKWLNTRGTEWLIQLWKSAFTCRPLNLKQTSTLCTKAINHLLCHYDDVPCIVYSLLAENHFLSHWLRFKKWVWLAAKHFFYFNAILCALNFVDLCNLQVVRMSPKLSKSIKVKIKCTTGLIFAIFLVLTERTHFYYAAGEVFHKPQRDPPWSQCCTILN